MASKKQHLRKQRNKDSQQHKAGSTGDGNPQTRVVTGPEINNLDLFSIFSIVKEKATTRPEMATTKPDADHYNGTLLPVPKQEAIQDNPPSDEASKTIEAEKEDVLRIQAEEEARLHRLREAEAAERERRERAEAARIQSDFEEAQRKRREEEAAERERRERAEVARIQSDFEEAQRKRREAAAAERERCEKAEVARIQSEFEDVQRKRRQEEELARREAMETAERQRRELAELERRSLEIEAEKQRREAEEAELERRRIEEEDRRRREAEEAERIRREVEEAEKKRRDQEAAAEVRRAAEAAERRRVEVKEAERLRLEAVAAERQRRVAEETEWAKRRAEEGERLRREEEEVERSRCQAENRERQGLEMEAIERAAREAREAEERRLAVEQAAEAERQRLEAIEAERQCREAEEAEMARRKVEEEERQRRQEKAAREAEEGERQRQLAEEEAERLRREAEEKELARRQTEERERRRREAEEALLAQKAAEEKERRHQEADAAERARRMADETETARRDAQARREAIEAGERQKREEEAERQQLKSYAEPQAPAMFEGEGADLRDSAGKRTDSPKGGREPSHLSAPPLEVDNPYWEKPPEIFAMLSGAPQSADPYGVAARESAGVLPVTMPGGFPDASSIQAYYENSPVDDDHDQRAEIKRHTIPVPMEKRMYIVMVTPEVAPCAKVGGLGDVILGLGRELMKRGHGVEVICPMYASMRYDQIYDLHEEYGELWCPHFDEWRSEKVFQGKVEGRLQVNFITGGTYTERPSIYGFEDDLQRFTYFSRQALEFMYKTNRRPDIIHCHDWATGLVPAILWDIYEKLGWDNSRVTYTIHNNECQGLCGFGDKLLAMVGLDVKKYLLPDKMQDDTHKNCINMMKSGIVFSNFVTTVSPTYAGELKTAIGGRGLQTTIAKNSAKVGGVLNGIDYDSWNPETDPKLTANYSGGDTFFEKYRNKTALREWLGLWDSWKPIVSVVTRLTQQKGLDLIKHAICATQERQAQFVLLGSAPDPKVNAEFLRIQNDMKDNHDVSLYIGYHEDLSRLIYAGSDLFLIPSLYEPCGLTQMISLRYGTVPIVRETGGLVDTVFDLDNSGLGLNDANGFTFRDPTLASLNYGLDRAIRLWYDNPEAFNRLARNGMRYDYSWRNPAEHYENIYNYIKA